MYLSNFEKYKKCIFKAGREEAEIEFAKREADGRVEAEKIFQARVAKETAGAEELFQKVNLNFFRIKCYFIRSGRKYPYYLL